MKLKSVAEGIESLDQVQQLQGLGVSLLQGYYFSRPIPANEIKENYPL
jgi:EAL domain-containing protein (putative c-di-GMP-specific phosphodiesterase class I)